MEISPVDICTYIMASCRDEVFFRQGALCSVIVFTLTTHRSACLCLHICSCACCSEVRLLYKKTWAQRNKFSHGDCMWCMPRADWASDTQFQLRLRCLMWNRSNHLPVDSVPVDVSAHYQWMWTLHRCMSMPAMATCEWEHEWIASKVLFRRPRITFLLIFIILLNIIVTLLHFFSL